VDLPAVTVVVPPCAVVAWWLYLRLGRHVFDRTGDPESLRHVALLARAWRRTRR
jgi:hypothetical protein